MRFVLMKTFIPAHYKYIVLTKQNKLTIEAGAGTEGQVVYFRTLNSGKMETSDTHIRFDLIA